ncbi:flagellar biosynthetic protein FliQ [Ruminococcaceae bacterium OttesenSCG-928-I18]|nr:flagellar biosynthetic protein FliQ [Ruminococcaceae bacterium OttesenSCG-928-I18]
MLSSGQVLDVMRQMLIVCIQIAGPILIGSIIIGLIIAVFQAATQIHEQTLTFVPKLLVIALMLLIMGSWIYSTISNFTFEVFDLMTAF